MNPEAAVGAAQTIPGWCSAGELRWLAEQAREREAIVEVGCWQGRSTKVLAAMTPGVVYAVDDFRGAGGAAADGWFHEGFPLGTGATPRDDLEQLFRTNLAQEIERGKVIVLGAASPEASELVETTDMVYLDGDHDTEPVRTDIRTWGELLLTGGLLCGHDAFDSRVQEALELEGIEFEIVAHEIWRAT